MTTENNVVRHKYDWTHVCVWGTSIVLPLAGIVIMLKVSLAVGALIGGIGIGYIFGWALMYQFMVKFIKDAGVKVEGRPFNQEFTFYIPNEGDKCVN